MGIKEIKKPDDIIITDATLKYPSYPYAANPSLDAYFYWFTLYIVR